MGSARQNVVSSAPRTVHSSSGLRNSSSALERPARRRRAVPRLRWSMELAVAGAATAVAIVQYAYWNARGLTLAYSDAISHMEIARRVWFSSTPGLAQLGSNWLPLDHILMLPLIWNDSLYRSGLGGAIPSMLCYVVGCTGMAALARALFGSMWAGLLAAAAYGANPNMLYLQATAMSESSLLASSVLLALCLTYWIKAITSGGWRFTWRWHAPESTAIGGVADHALAQAGGARPDAPHWEWQVTGAARRTAPPATRNEVTEIRGKLTGLPELAPLILLAAAACAATLLRYDGWALALAAGFCIVAVAFLLCGPRVALGRLIVFGLLGFAGMVGWLLYNWIIFGDPLDFYRGLYSANHQQQHIAATNGLQTKHNAPLAFRIYWQTVLDSFGAPILIAAGIGLLIASLTLVIVPIWRWRRTRRLGTTIQDPMHRSLAAGLAWVAVGTVLASPLAFNWAALYSGSTIIQTPEIPLGLTLQAHAYFNDRYGLMVLPLVALAVAALAPITIVAVNTAAEQLRSGRILSRVTRAMHSALVAGAIVLLLCLGAAGTLVGTPYVLGDPLYGEAAQGEAHAKAEAAYIKAHYTGGLILASTSTFPALTFLTELPDDTFINEGNKAHFAGPWQTLDPGRRGSLLVTTQITMTLFMIPWLSVAARVGRRTTPWFTTTIAHIFERDD